MRAVAGTRWLGVVLLVSVVGSGVILVTRLTEPTNAFLDLVVTRLPLTFAAAVATPALSALLGVGLGLVTAHRGGWVDHTMRALVVAGLSMCLGWAVLMSAGALALRAELSPLLTDDPLSATRLSLLSSLLLPAIAVLLGAALAVSVHVRVAARAVSLDGFVLTARLRGLPTTGLVIRRVLRRTGPAVLTVLAAEATLVYCGALIMQAIYTRAAVPADLPPMLPAWSLPVILGCGFCVSLGVVLVALGTATAHSSTLDGSPLLLGSARADGGPATDTDAEPLASMPSVLFRSAGFLDIRGLRIQQTPLDPDRDGPGDAVNLTIARGETLAILGDVASGADQLCRAIIGLLPRRTPVRSGSILFDGRELVGLAEREFRRLRGHQIGYLDAPAGYHFDLSHRVGRSLTSVLARRVGASHRSTGPAALQLLDRVGVEAPQVVFASYPQQLSAVTAHRVLLAGVIALEPPLVIAVDPTRGLDADAGTGFLDLLHDLQRERGFTLIVISARVDVVARCERVAVMMSGTIVEHASASDLLADPKHPHSRYLINAMGADSSSVER